MAILSFHPDRVGVALASAVGLVTASYFELEARGAVPNILEAHSQLLADVFSERIQAHTSVIIEPRARALAFAIAFSVSLATARGHAASARGIRIVYDLATFVIPLIALTLTLVMQPLSQGELCAPCLLESLFSLAIVECRRGPARPTAAAPIRVPLLDAETWRRSVSSTAAPAKRLGRDDAHR